MANYAKEQNWDIIGVLNNDMIGDINVLDGIVVDNYFFGIASVEENAFDSAVVFPNAVF